MTNYIKSTFFAAAIVASLASCDMDAPSISTLDGSSVYSVYSLAEAEVMSINVSFAETNSYRGRFTPFYGMNTDIETLSAGTPASKANDDKNALCNYGTTPANGQMNTANNAYAKFYEGIERANMAIQGLKEYGDIDNRKEMGQLYGEALTLRAVIYSDLVKAWGDVPARFEPNSAENVYLPRTSKDVIYKQLLADLEEAANYLYWPNENGITSTTERANKAFAKGLRARIALQAGGYNLYGDGYRRSTDPELSEANMMAIAKQECIDIINSGYNTLGTFEENFRNLCKDVTSAGKESLWEIPFSDARGRVMFTFAVEHKAKDQDTEQARGGQNAPSPTLYYDYDVEDVRRDITCVPYQWSATAIEGSPALTCVGDAKATKIQSYQELRNVSKWCFGKLRYEWMDRMVTNQNDDGVNWQYMRLADVYMMAAEAVNYIDGPSAAWQYMKPILDRALPAEKVAALQTQYTASKEAFQNGVIDQRAFEFAGEMLRKSDLIRWGIIDQKLATQKQKLTNLAAQTGDYSDLPNKLYYTMYDGDDDGFKESIRIYGLNHGDTDEEGKRLEDEQGYSSTTWIASTTALTNDYIEGLYVNQPSLNCYWPIWTYFIGTSNGLLNNEGYVGQLK